MRRAGVLALTCVILAGCGGGGRLSHARYERHLEADAATARGSATLSVRPPTGAVADNAAIVAALRSTESFFRRAARAAVAGNWARLGTILEKSTTRSGALAATKAARAARTNLRARGYAAAAAFVF